MTYQCTVCKEAKSDYRYDVVKGVKYRRLYCRDCMNQKNREQKRIRFSDPSERIKKRQQLSDTYYRTNRIDPEKIRIRGLNNTRAWRAKNPELNREHSRARDIVYKAIKRGVLKRPDTCSQCSLKSKVHAHHENYNKPLEIEWLCPKCHKGKHCLSVKEFV